MSGLQVLINSRYDYLVEIAKDPLHDLSKSLGFDPSEDSDQPWHATSLIRVFTDLVNEESGGP